MVKVMGIEITDETYCKLLRLAQTIPEWNSLSEHTRKIRLLECI